MPISSYAPEFLELFKRAAQAPITIPLGNENKAIRLRFRLNCLRKELRHAYHPLATIANSVQFTITPDFDLYAYPADDHFLEALHEAGVSIPPPTPDEETPAKPQSPEQTLRDFFATETEKE